MEQIRLSALDGFDDDVVSGILDCRLRALNVIIPTEHLLARISTVLEERFLELLARARA